MPNQWWASQQHPAWMLLAARRGPLMLSGMEALFEHQRDGVLFDAAVQALSDMLAAHANDPDFEIAIEDVASQARYELRDWLKRGLITEREGRIFDTDALNPDPHSRIHGARPTARCAKPSSAPSTTAAQ